MVRLPIFSIAAWAGRVLFIGTARIESLACEKSQGAAHEVSGPIGPLTSCAALERLFPRSALAGDAAPREAFPGNAAAGEANAGDATARDCLAGNTAAGNRHAS